jgi:hypothetical protein
MRRLPRQATDVSQFAAQGYEQVRSSSDQSASGSMRGTMPQRQCGRRRIVSRTDFLRLPQRFSVHPAHDNVFNAHGGQ